MELGPSPQDLFYYTKKSSDPHHIGGTYMSTQDCPPPDCVATMMQDVFDLL